MYPGFETLSEAEQENLREYTNSIKRGVKEELYKDPAIAHSKKVYAETKWNEAFEAVSTEYPELKGDPDFKKKYFNPNNVPENIGDLMKDLAKVHLFDKSKEIGARDAIEKAGHYEIERANGGDKTPTASRSLQDWSRMAQENPAEFARHSKEYKADLESGRL
jgi:transketolase